MINYVDNEGDDHDDHDQDDQDHDDIDHESWSMMMMRGECKWGEREAISVSIPELLVCIVLGSTSGKGYLSTTI